MTILRWTPRAHAFHSPFSELGRLRREMEGVFDALSSEPSKRGAGVFPLLNLAEDQDNLYLTAELPGVNSEKLDVSVHGDSLTIRGERELGEVDQKVNIHRREREAGVFRRIVNLPAKVDSDNVQALLKNGVLMVTLPKAAEAKPKQISIKAE